MRWRSLEFRIPVLLILRTNYSDDDECYALSQLEVSDLKLKNEQKQAIYAVYGGKDVCFPTGLGESEGENVCFQILPFLFDHKCGKIGRTKRSCAIIISRLVALMVD